MGLITVLVCIRWLYSHDGESYHCVMRYIICTYFRFDEKEISMEDGDIV